MFDMLIGLGLKKLPKSDVLMEKETAEMHTTRTFTLANAIFAS